MNWLLNINDGSTSIRGSSGRRRHYSNEFSKNLATEKGKTFLMRTETCQLSYTDITNTNVNMPSNL